MDKNVLVLRGLRVMAETQNWSLRLLVDEVTKIIGDENADLASDFIYGVIDLERLMEELECSQNC